MEYYSAMKRKQNLTYIATGRNLDKTMLSEIKLIMKGQIQYDSTDRGS